MLITTSVCGNYLPKAMVMARSVKETNPDCRVVVCLLEHEIPAAVRDFPYFDAIVLAKELGIDDFERFMFKHAIVEASTAVKGRLFLYLMARYGGEERFVYLDPDIKVFGEMTELKEAMAAHPIVLTPHLCHPGETPDEIRAIELGTLQHGVFNLGFLGITRSPEGERFVRWWASRLELYCYDDIPGGIFTDQRWVDLALGFFELYILKHPGYNAAPWNVSRRSIVYNGRYEVNGEPLRFFHFSGVDFGGNVRMIRRFARDKDSVVHSLQTAYARELKTMGQDELGRMPWHYDYYRSGERIRPEARHIFRSLPGAEYRDRNPFELSGAYFDKYIDAQRGWTTALSLVRLLWLRISGR